MNVLFDIDDRREQLPTLRQWLKSNGKRKLAKVYPIFKVWKPGKYKTICFETEHFRALLDDGNPLFKQVAGGLDNFCDGSRGLGICPDPEHPGKFQLVSMDNEKPTVECLGEAGYKFRY